MPRKRESNLHPLTKLIGLSVIFIAGSISLYITPEGEGIFQRFIINASIVAIALMGLLCLGVYLYEKKTQSNRTNLYPNNSFYPKKSHYREEKETWYEPEIDMPLTEILSNITLRGKNTIVTPTEKKFKEHLRQHLPAIIEIHCKTGLIDILHPEIKKKLNNTWKYKKYYMMHVDFTLVLSETQEIILVIELDDKSHISEKAKINDAAKNEILEASKVDIIRVPVENMFDSNIRERIIETCKLSLKNNMKP